MKVNKNDFKIQGPFKLWTIENFPFIEADFDAITNYQLYSKIVEYLKKIAENQTDLNDNYNELITAFNSLVGYVDDYFENLDVQNEIDNKLDEMAESGVLSEIITQYLQINGVLAFNTIADLYGATNVIDGSICYCLGSTTYNDGDGAFYKVREVINTDVVDGYYLVTIASSDDLVAERIVSMYITDLVNLTKRVNHLDRKKYIFIGDSYNTTDTPAGGVPINPWSSFLVSFMGLSSSDYYNSGVSGAGWIHGTTFLSQLQTLSSSITNKNDITDIVVLGGINDSAEDYASNIYTAFDNFSTYVATNYPNAKIHIGMISWSKDQATRKVLVNIAQNYNGSGNNFPNMRSIGNAHVWFHDYNNYQPDGHPARGGNLMIALQVANYLKGGCESMTQNYTKNVTATQTDLITDTGTIATIYMSQDNNIITVEYKPSLTYLTTGLASITTDSPYKIGDITGSTVIWNANGFGEIIDSGIAYILKTDLSTWVQLPYQIALNERGVYLRFKGVDSSGNITVANPKRIYLYSNTGKTTISACEC